MSARERLERFLHTDPADSGCAETMSLMHVFAELVLSGVDAAARYPRIAAHLAGCDACNEDFTGLLAALSR
ncbi:hypothetical protein AB4Z18_03045 [Leifsonia sp. 2TAF2]|uniref:hypothetical protein n=1 Tax=Leifsonia sp. 2TAF2 TaxID=3233009 RepID=UPI003F961487